MTAPVAVSQHSERSDGSQLVTVQTDKVRAQLLAEADNHAAMLARCTNALITSAPENTTDLARAMNALRMYRAREALEEIEGALARVEAGSYGICLACDRPIPLERLATIPQARFCGACPPASAAAEGSPGPRLGPGRGEHTGTPPPVRSPRPFDRPPVQPMENARGYPSSNSASQPRASSDTRTSVTDALARSPSGPATRMTGRWLAPYEFEYLME